MSTSYRPSPLRVSDSAWALSNMIDSQPGTSASSSRDLVPAPRASDLQIILRTRDHAAYYDPTSNELSLLKRRPDLNLDDEPASTDAPLVPHRNGNSSARTLLQTFSRPPPLTSSSHEAVCPTCARPWPLPHDESLDSDYHRFEEEEPSPDGEPPSFIAPNYFRLLAQASTTPGNSTPNNRFESASGTSTPDPYSHPSTPPQSINPDSSAQGYYSRFFHELKPLGRGARGQVFLCQHVLNGNPLGKYAIKKIPVGNHAQSLLQSLNEVHLMESLHHPHLIHYQHAWIERAQLSQFGPEVPTLFVLMMAANGGSLADWISARAGDAQAGAGGGGEGDSQPPSGDRGVKGDDAGSTQGDRRKIERLKAALRQRRATRTSSPTPPSQTGPGVGVHLLRLDEIHSLLSDITSGLSFLHSRGILHLDIKPGNILLHWDEDSLTPRAMLSDFGSSLLLHDAYSHVRSGHTGTMEYMSPETIFPDPTTGKLRELGSKADIWSLGIILHLLLFFKLPYSQIEDIGELKGEIGRYKGFRRRNLGDCKGRRGDERLLGLLERMLQIEPSKRPGCGEILEVLQEGKEKEQGRKRGRKTRERKGSEGVSLALYRPTALPPLPKQRRSLEPPTPARLLPVEAVPVAVALFKCLSPALLQHFLGREPANTLPATIASGLILLLALIDLSTTLTAPPSNRTYVRETWFWAGHVSLLAWWWAHGSAL